MNNDTLAKFGNEFQSKAISAMLSDKAFLDQAYDIIDPKHFEADAHSWLVDRILWYYSTYKNIPSLEVFKAEIDKVKGDNGLRSTIISSLRDVHTNIHSSDVAYIRDEFLTFCKNQALKNAIFKSADKLSTGDYDSIKSIIDKAMQAGQPRDFGHNYKADMDERFAKSTRTSIATEWSVIDHLMDGGLAGGELGIIAAPSGAGKSWLLANIGKSALLNGKKVLHYTFELNQKYLGTRYDTMFTGIEPNNIKNHVDSVRTVVQGVDGELYIKYYPGSFATINTLMAHYKRLTDLGFIPDVILVDYSDLMLPLHRSGVRHEDLGTICENLRGMAGEISTPIWTASQTQRSSMNDDVIEGDKIAESIRKLMTADFLMSLSRKTSDKMTNTGRVHIIKNRFGPDGDTFPAYIDYAKGVVKIFKENSVEGMALQKKMKTGEDDVKSGLREKLAAYSKKDPNLRMPHDSAPETPVEEIVEEEFSF